ncbi:MAG TPA: ABC transporter permease [Kiritimatiellia bacterium]|nr:ABC transporter permease [Kiritimatiellia bacterium]HMO97486.1 ABC transporter permease [Kiritimatiellia bacterium]HMP96295.1 ABC transporter permease [Kiritimatiellia bacterium]
MHGATASRKSLTEWLVSIPTVVWLLVFFVVPTLTIFAIAFRPVNLDGGIGTGWTLETWRGLANPNYPSIVWRTVRLSVATTFICLALAVPCGYFMARVRESWRQALLLLVVVPFWTNFLVRVFAWRELLHPEGWLKQGLVFLGLAAPEAQLLYNEYAVLLVLVYTHLPFAILPIYAAAEKFDFRLTEAARDLGAGALRAFWNVFIPGINRGLLTAFLVVFIPALGSYVIPDIMGGPSSKMIGNKIAQRTFSDRNWPHASGLSALLTLAVLGPMVVVLMLQGRRQPAANKEGPA